MNCYQKLVGLVLNSILRVLHLIAMHQLSVSIMIKGCVSVCCSKLYFPICNATFRRFSMM